MKPEGELLEVIDFCGAVGAAAVRQMALLQLFCGLIQAGNVLGLNG
ncbi:hypothetical protein [Rhizobium binae]|uniref:Uncharacterized protein n=1 Tax=Rhizobium binae TaxID=1138190 RepID=A0ABV2MHC0_9HYPH|nr:hypothetical protein [Rhizobium binae]MBX4927858.1 hypothetical protein [Rhizobium binae]MBX4938482.1 hypothetical protein [Rhizobium binae]MBX4944989.1 hypothetical protein [Rhizobium binae]MBX4952197.1 hypothetical protein [Rhizobium binae]MBX4961532.1 hypothetical protein [Rhizobium binae]